MRVISIILKDEQLESLDQLVINANANKRNINYKGLFSNGSEKATRQSIMRAALELLLDATRD